jgi:hypothetical protein
MDKKYILYYRFTTTQAITNDELILNYRVCADGRILSVYRESPVGAQRMIALQAAVNDAKTQNATLVIAELNAVANHFTFYRFGT